MNILQQKMQGEKYLNN